MLTAGGAGVDGERQRRDGRRPTARASRCVALRMYAETRSSSPRRDAIGAEVAGRRPSAATRTSVQRRRRALHVPGAPQRRRTRSTARRWTSSTRCATLCRPARSSTRWHRTTAPATTDTAIHGPRTSRSSDEGQPVRDPRLRQQLPRRDARGRDRRQHEQLELRRRHEPEGARQVYEGNAETNTLELDPLTAGHGARSRASSATPSRPRAPARARCCPVGDRYTEITLQGDPDNHPHLVFEDDEGRKTGIVDGEFVDDIPEVEVVSTAAIENWESDPEPRYRFPEGGEYVVTIDGTDLERPRRTVVNLVGAGLVIEVEDITIAPGQQDGCAARGLRDHLREQPRYRGGARTSSPASINGDEAYIFAASAVGIAKGSAISLLVVQEENVVILDSTGSRGADGKQGRLHRQPHQADRRRRDRGRGPRWSASTAGQGREGRLRVQRDREGRQAAAARVRGRRRRADRQGRSLSPQDESERVRPGAPAAAPRAPRSGPAAGSRVDQQRRAPARARPPRPRTPRRGRRRSRPAGGRRRGRRSRRASSGPGMRPAPGSVEAQMGERGHARAAPGGARRPSPPSRCTTPGRNMRPGREGARPRWTKGSGRCPRRCASAPAGRSSDGEAPETDDPVDVHEQQRVCRGFAAIL